MTRMAWGTRLALKLSGALEARSKLKENNKNPKKQNNKTRGGGLEAPKMVNIKNLRDSLGSRKQKREEEEDNENEGKRKGTRVLFPPLRKKPHRSCWGWGPGERGKKKKS